MAKAKYTIDEVIHALTTSFGGELDQPTRTWYWPSVPDATPQISYAIGVAPYWQESSDAAVKGIVAMGPQQLAATHLAFQLWDDLVPFDIVQSPTNNSSSGIIFNFSSDSKSTTHAQDLAKAVNGDREIGTMDIWIDSTRKIYSDAGVAIGGRGLQSIEHEIGHALGLSHPGPYNGSGNYNSDAVYAQDTRQYTVMSYFGYYDNNPATSANGWRKSEDKLGKDGGTENGHYLYPQTPMVDDIAAIQSKYGADTDTRVSDTTYGYHCNIWGSTDPDALDELHIYDFTLNPTPIFTIWDSQGDHDTLDCSLYAGPQTINLTPGSYSSVNGLIENVAIAYNCYIEDAIGGRGTDLITGSSAANVIDGGAGNDQISGGGGADTIIGGPGADGMRGGARNDTFYVDNGDANGGDVVIGGIDWDTIWADASVAISGLHLILVPGTTALGKINHTPGVSAAMEVEEVHGGDGGDILDASRLPSSPIAALSHVYLYGEGSNDILISGAGNDRLDGGLGSDSFIIGNGTQDGGDVVEGGANGSLTDWDVVWADASVVNRDGTGGLRLALYASGTDPELSSHTPFMSVAMNVDEVYGSSAGDIVNASRDGIQRVVFHGDGGNDLFYGGTAADLFEGGADTDTIGYGGPASNYMISSDTNDPTWYSIQDRTTKVIDRVHDVEKIQFGDGVSRDLAGVAGVTRIGTTGSDSFTGTAGNDHLEGLDGMDFLTGGGGADELLGGPGTDFLYIDDQDTLIDGGPDFDYVYLEGFSQDPAGNHFTVTDQMQIEYVGGALVNDMIDASATTKGIFLLGNYGSDVLIGGSGADWLSGSPDTDTLTGGAGIDTFYFADYWGRDTITDFTHGQDILDLSGVTGLNSFDQLAISDTPEGANISFNGDTIVLRGIAASTVTASDFHL